MSTCQTRTSCRSKGEAHRRIPPFSVEERGYFKGDGCDRGRNTRCSGYVPSYLGLSAATPSYQHSTVSRLTGKLDPGLEPPRVQMHRFDPPPLISPRPLLITLRFEDYLDLGWFMDFRQRTKESPEFGLTADLL